MCLSTWNMSHFMGFPPVFRDEKFLHAMTGRTKYVHDKWNCEQRHREGEPGARTLVIWPCTFWSLRRARRAQNYICRLPNYFKNNWKTFYSNLQILVFNRIPLHCVYLQWMKGLHDSSFWDHSLKCSATLYTLSCLALRLISHSVGGPSSSTRHHPHLQSALMIHWRIGSCSGSAEPHSLHAYGQDTTLLSTDTWIFMT